MHPRPALVGGEGEPALVVRQGGQRAQRLSDEERDLLVQPADVDPLARVPARKGALLLRIAEPQGGLAEPLGIVQEIVDDDQRRTHRNRPPSASPGITAKQAPSEDSRFPAAPAYAAAMSFAQTCLALPTGVTLNVATAGAPDAEPIVFLHGFPESHRTWREVAPALAEDYFVVCPDQRGFGASDKPEGVEQYRTERIVEDLIALADALELKRFTLVGHDWGGAVAWLAALRHPDRLNRLIIVNAPHPLVFQKSLIDDAAQRAASQYITAFRNPGDGAGARRDGAGDVLRRRPSPAMPTSRKSPARSGSAYLADWRAPGALTAMLNWYRASEVVVPAPGETAELPAWTKLPFPVLKVPTLVIWAMRDTALLPVQLGGLGDLVENLKIVQVPDAGHFIPWEKPAPVVRAIGISCGAHSR